MQTQTFAHSQSRRQQAGASLIIVLILLGVMMALGAGAVQLSMMGERSARNDRDYQVAWQASEAALVDAELDIDIKNAGTSTRMGSFTENNSIDFLANCGSSGVNKGLCLPNQTGKPVWLAVDFSATDSPSVELGDFTSSEFDSGTSGLKPRKKPRYIIEILTDTASRGDASIGGDQRYVYRVTAMGFGPRTDIQAMNQIIYRK